MPNQRGKGSKENPEDKTWMPGYSPSMGCPKKEKDSIEATSHMSERSSE
jgi:hypothetical protein